jgi:CBS domain-containing protein
MLKNRISGAPVVDRDGKCVGVLSATDFLRLAGKRTDVTKPASPALPITCSFQRTFRAHDGQEITLCTLPLGVCPIQRRQKEPDGEEQIVCAEPHSVPVDWQMVEVENLPVDAVRRFMTPDPVIARPDAPIRFLARMMIDAHIHRVIVVNEARRPIGVVSSTDVLAALAYSDDEQ